MRYFDTRMPALAMLLALCIFSCIRIQDKVIKYPSGKIKEKYSYFVDEKGTELKDGLWTKWYENGTKQEESNWQEGVRIGAWIKWYENGQKKEESNWLNDLKTGQHTKWHKGGQIMYQAAWQEGIQQGKETYWYENGKKKSEVEIKKGKPDGIKTTWDEAGNLFSEEEWIQGEIGSIKTHVPKEKLRTYQLEFSKEVLAEQFTYYVDPEGQKVKHGRHFEWYPNGQQEREAVFQAGKKEGEEKWFYKNGKLKSKTSWKYGKKHGKEKTWWDNGLKKTEDNYHFGNLEGESIHWYANGKKKSEVFYVKNELDGKALYWYETGALKSKYHYKNQKLDGQVVQNYPNGNKKSECEYANGIQHGVCSHWYENGIKKSEAIYKDGSKQKGTEMEWDETGKTKVKDQNTLIAKILLEEKTISAARVCRNTQQDIKNLQNELESQTQYMDLQQKEIRLNRMMVESEERCQEFRDLIGQYKAMNSADSVSSLIKEHNLQEILQPPETKADTPNQEG